MLGRGVRSLGAQLKRYEQHRIWLLLIVAICLLSPVLTEIVFSVFVDFHFIPVELVLTSPYTSRSRGTEHFTRVSLKVKAKTMSC